MKIGIITDSVSHYGDKYPHLREEIPIFQELVEAGHELILLSPTGSPNTMKIFRAEKDSSRPLADWFTLGGLAMIPEDEEPECDVLLLLALPWMHGFNYTVINDIVKWAPKFDKIFMWDVDYILHKKKDSFFEKIQRDLPEVFKKIEMITCNSDYVDTYKAEGVQEAYYIPHTFAGKALLSTKPSADTRRDKFASMVGPMGYRTNLLPWVDAAYTLSNNIPFLYLDFYGEEYAAKYRDSRIDMFDSYENNNTFQVHSERIFKPYHEYLKFLSGHKFHLHDSIAPGWLGEDCRESPYFSHKIYDAIYAGCLPITTRFKYVDSIIPKEIGNLLIVSEDVEVNMKNIHTLDGLPNSTLRYMYDEIYKNLETYYGAGAWANYLISIFQR
ncbi:hypothetical protein M1M30_gp114 [Maribacter phage Colly_1]|uniref:Uncharacterized protein n=1 Tax=Maribacter phage Colly_1 TaxID=2745691 RepID=A0A8E4XXX8_9CAUD|nr:hypothetical protein M1M30_gp114 [Maribacter phage Colly_1]QQO97212.1 hypothetical protein Colly1_114 [Maribacter phage Colly_1]